MYGFVNSALEKLVRRRFGSEKWEEIRQRANILGERSTFLVNTVYKDEDTYVVVKAATEVLGLDAATLLEMFGEQFLVWCKESGYAKTLQLLGRSLQDFLTNLDALHDHLSIIYPQMDAPSFRCTEGKTKKEFHLHYYSSRDGLESIVKGIVKSVAREFYGVEVEMKLIKGKGEDGHDHSEFHIKQLAFYEEKQLTAPTQFVESHADKQLITGKSFCKAFPFHIVFDRDMSILQVGTSLAWILPQWAERDKKLTSFFILDRPRMKLTFTNIMSHINTIFIFRMTYIPSSVSDNNTTSDPMRLRGQMIFLPESDCILFLCSPRVRSIHDLDQRGLYLSDIPIHDATRGLLMMSQTARSEFHHVVELEEVIGQLNLAQKSLEEEKGRMRDLLHQMLPISIADSLMAGQMIEAERFECVTILFSDIYGFTKICGKCEPIQIVSMLNKLYTMFDYVVGRNRVYKVETIGDAYMVVGGLPESNNVHAECVANQALDMMHYCKQVNRPDSEEHIQMRIGIHSGEVVAGIVGRRMPRYCLFGNAVNIASRAEANGEPGKIQVTEVTHKLLADKPNFKFEVRGPLQFKNVDEPMMCYFLIENTDKTEYLPIIVPDEILYDFMPTSGTPPGTPFMFSGNNALESPWKRAPAFPFAPELTVINPTPGHSPNPSPPTTAKVLHSLVTPTCPFSDPNKNSSRKTSIESVCSQNTESASLTQSESDLSILSNEDGHSSGIGSVISSPITHVSSVDVEGTRILINSVENLDSRHKIIYPLQEDLREDFLDDYDDLLNTKSEPLLKTKDEVQKERDRRHRSSSFDRSDRSLSVTSEDSFDDDSSTPTSPNHVGKVRYVRQRTSSLHERVRFFETNDRSRRTGLSTTSYLHNIPSVTLTEEHNGTTNGITLN